MRYNTTPDEHYVRRQRWMIAVIVMLALTVLLVRLQLHPGFDEDAFEDLYDALCTELQTNGDGQELYQDTRKMFRRAGTKPDVLFLYQFVGIYAGKLPHPPQLANTDEPIYDAVIAGNFDDALSQTHMALLQDDSMTEGRARAWGKLIRSLQQRWDNNCVAPK